MLKNKIKINNIYIKENLHLIIPILGLFIVTLLYLLRVNFLLHQDDFICHYKGGIQFLINPKYLYDNYCYYYLPSLAMLWDAPLALFPLFEAHYINYFAKIILVILFIREYNRVLILMDVKEKVHRFLFLIIISANYYVYHQFYMNQYKFIIAVIFVFIIRRELQYRRLKKDKDLKFYIVNYGLFLFAVGTYPFLIFIFLIYIFQNINYNEVFKKENIQKYGIVIIWFFIQNIAFIFYPSLIFDFLNLYNKHNQHDRRAYIPLFYLREFTPLNPDQMEYFPYIMLTSVIFTCFITLILIIKKDLHIEKKFSYFALFSIFLSTYARRILVIYYPLSLFLLIPFMKQDKKGFDFIKDNKVFLIGFLSIALLSFMFPSETIFKYLPFLLEFPFLIFVYLRYLFLLCIFGSSLLILHKKEIKKLK